jgi:hypothetical protein
LEFDLSVEQFIDFVGAETDTAALPEKYHVSY